MKMVYKNVHLKYMVYENSLGNFPSEIHGYFHKPFS